MNELRANLCRRLAYVQGDIGLLIGANVLNNAVTFIVSVVIAALVSAEEFGIYSVAVNVTMLVFAVSEAGLGISVLRHYGQEADEMKRTEILRTGVVLRILISLVVAIMAIPLSLVLSYAISDNHPITKELAIGVISAGALGLWASTRSTQQATQNYKSYARLTVLYGLNRLCVTMILYVAGARDAIVFLGGLYLISPLLTSLWFYFSFNRRYGLWPIAINRDLARRLFAYGRWVVVSYILSPLCYTLPLFLLLPVRGAEVAGVYGVGLMFCAIVGPVSDALGAFVVPKVAAYTSSSDVRAYIVRTLGFRWHLLGVVVFAILSCSLVFQILFAEKYPNGLVTMQVLLGANCLASYGGMLNCVTHYIGIPHFNALANLLKIILCGAGALVLIPDFGAPGAAAAAASAAIAGELGLFVTIRRRLEQNSDEAITV